MTQTRRWPLPLFAGLAIAAAFLVLNHQAFNGWFQDDELDNIKWVPLLPYSYFLLRLPDPRFDLYNFRPVGHFFFRLMSPAFGMNFAPYVVPIFFFHLVNACLLYLLMRKLGTRQWCAIAATAFFTLSAAAFDTYWKPVYVFDLLCTTFSLMSVLFYAGQRWILSFIAFWLAYKAKETAVMLPAVLAAWEYWFGSRRLKILIPFFAVSLSFGIQGLLRNPNKDNDYTFRFTFDALRHTLPFYSKRLLMFPPGGILLCALAFIRDRRIWFGIVSTLLIMVPLAFLPGRVFEAYAYLPFAFVSIALAAAASRVHPAWAWIALLLWMPFNIRRLRNERRATLDLDSKIAAVVSSMKMFADANPSVRTLVFNSAPAGFHDWGMTAGWNLAHRQIDWPVLWFDSADGRAALAAQTVAWGSWSDTPRRFTIHLRAKPDAAAQGKPASDLATMNNSNKIRTGATTTPRIIPSRE